MKGKRLLAIAACLAPLAVMPPVARADVSIRGTQVFAITGDNPYGATQEAGVPALVSAINADPDVSRVFHVGDFKSSGVCSDAYFTRIRDNFFNQLNDPTIVTPGDNDWTDCHRSDNGSLDPVARLTALRKVMYPTPGQTLGKTKVTVDTQSLKEPTHSAFVENYRWRFQNVLTATVHVVGSGNGCDTWAVGAGGQAAANQARMNANLSWIDSTFARAKNENAPGVLLFMQAEPTTGSCFNAIRQRIVNQIKDPAKPYGKPVLIVHGDEHFYEAQTSFAGVPNLTRLEVCGAQVKEWVKLTINTADPKVFSWTRMNPQSTCVH